MAVEVNVRKRKHTGQNEADAVPKKMQKKSGAPPQKKKKLVSTAVKKGIEESNDTQEAAEPPDAIENTEAQDSGFEEKPMKFPNDFKMLDFRTKLRGTNFITELRHFLYLMERKTRIVAKYIEKRGKPLELAESLERIEKSNLLHVSYICEALQAVVMEIVSNQPAHMESAVSACRYFLKVHSSVIEHLLESVQIKHRRIALKLLTAIVCVDPNMGRQILAAFNILSDTRKIDLYLSHSRFEQQDQETVRKCYIHFVLAFLVDGNSLLIQNILDRSALVQALVCGLLYDDHTTVCLVLTTLKKYVLENSSISKTKKVHVFNLECCRRLVRLYDWLGPRVFAAKFAPKKAKTDANSLPKEKIGELLNAEEKETVAATAHEFLLILLCSRKHGIAFDASTQVRQKHNAIQGKIIGFIQKPWCCERKTELVVKMLKACPDLARHTVRHFSNIINPQRTGEKEFISSANFLRDVISTLHPDLLHNALKRITLTDFAFWIKDICLPLETLIMLKSMMRNTNVEFRLASHQLFLAMFTQYSNFMDAAMQREQAKGGGSTLRRFKFDMFSHIITHFPSVDHILQSLNLTIGLAQCIQRDVLLKHLDVTLDLVLVICKQNRSFVNRTHTVLDYIKLIRPLYAGVESDEDDDEDGNGTKHHLILSQHGDINLEIKAIKTILLLKPNALEPDQELFPHVMKSFIKGFIHGSDDIRNESGKLLRIIFKNTGIFDTSPLEIDLWLEALRFSDSVTVDVVTQVFMEVLKVTQAEVDLPTEIDTDTNKANLNKLFENVAKGHCVQAYVEAFGISKLLPLIFKGVEIVKPLDEYIELICLLLFHYHPTPSYVLQLYEMKFNTQPSYMKSWLHTRKHNSALPEACNKIPLLNELQNALLTENKNTNFKAIFGSTDEDAAFETEVDEDNYKPLPVLKNERLLMIYIQHIVFMVTRLLEKQQLTRSQAELAAQYVVNFLSIIYEIELKDNASNICYADEGTTATQRSFLGTLLTYIYDIRLSTLNSADLCNAKSEQSLHYVNFLTTVTEFCSKLPDFGVYVKNFRLKIIKSVAISVETIEITKQQPNKDFIKMIEAFQLNIENCMELLELLCKELNYKDFFISNTDGLERTFYFDLLICVLKRLTDLQQAVECEHIVKPLCKFYVNFTKKLSIEVNLEDYEHALYRFLYIMHKYIPSLDFKLFTCMFTERKLNKYSIKLAGLLLERNDKLHEKFFMLAPDYISKRELIYPLMEIMFKKKLNIDPNLLTKIYQEYRNGFMKTIEKPQKSGSIYKEHATCSVNLVTSCMPVTECLDFCKKRFQFNDSSEIYQIRLIHAIYNKAWNALENDAKAERSKIFVNFLNLQIQLMSVDLKRQSLTVDKLELFAYQIYDWFSKIQQIPIAADNDFGTITKSQQWLNFCKSCLKLSMKSTETADSEDAMNQRVLLLKFLLYLCDKLYLDYGSIKLAEEVESYEPAQLFEMISTHSKYYDIVLSTKPTPVKTFILGLLVTLAKKCPTVSLWNLEIPVVLGAYHAKLTESDRYALALLQLCEQYYPEKLQKYRPFIWGESAISFYALHVNDLNERTRLTQQETNINLVMSLIDYQTSEYTVDSFPIWRKLNSIQQLPIIDFIDPTNRLLYSLGSNNLERHIELNWSNSKSTVMTLPASIDLRLCPKADDVFINCYDPAFFIPLMSSCFAPSSCAHAARPVENGLLAMCFAALSSQDKEMRQAAGDVQLRYRTHFEQSKFFERPLWIQAYENIQAGLAELSSTWKAKHKNHSKEYQPIPRVPYIPTLFIAKTFNITNDPTNLLYKHLTMYLRLKNTFNFQCIPEFNVFFLSPEVEHHTFRQFIIDVIRKGVKCSSDLFLLVSTNTFKVLLAFYGGSMSNLETNLLILSAISTCVKIPASAKIIIEHVGILSWLKTIISTLEFYQFDVIEGVISIVNNLWYSVVATKADFYNYKYIALQLFYLNASLLPLLSSRISVLRFAKLLNNLQKTAETAQAGIIKSTPYAVVSDDQLDKILACAERHFGTDVQYLRNLKTLGYAGAGSHEAYCTLLQSQTVSEEAALALTSLRAFIVNWWKNRENLYAHRSLNVLELSTVVN